MLAGNERVTATPDEVRENTEKALRRPEADGNPRNFAYVNISSELPHDLPFTSIDQLFIDDTDITLGNCLLKCDVEGAESEVLKGSGKFLRKYRPDIMLSVHPSELVKLGSNKEDVVKLLRDYGYSHDVISVDHEEHWYCKPLKASLEAH
jgi:hypothetical protein